MEGKQVRMRLGERSLDFETPGYVDQSFGSISFSGTFDPSPKDTNIIFHGRFLIEAFSSPVIYTRLNGGEISGKILGRMVHTVELTRLSNVLITLGWVGYWVLFVWMVVFWKV